MNLTRNKPVEEIDAETSNDPPITPKRKLDITEKDIAHHERISKAFPLATTTGSNIELLVKNEEQIKFINLIHDTQKVSWKFNTLLLVPTIMLEILLIFINTYYVNDDIVKCKIPALEETKWTDLEKLMLSSPSPTRFGEMIGCYYYDYDYEKLANLSYELATTETQKTRNQIRLHRCREISFCYLEDPFLEFYDYCLEEENFILNYLIYCSVGIVVMFIPLGILSDIYGRKINFIVSTALTATGCILLLASVNIPMLIAAKVTSFVGLRSGFYTMIIYIIENSSPKTRAFMTLGALTGNPLGFLYIIAIDKMNLQYWRYSCILGIAIPLIITSVLLWFIPESPRWLMCYKKWERAWKSINELGSPKKSTAIEFEKAIPRTKLIQILRVIFRPCRRVLNNIRSAYLFSVAPHTILLSEVYTIKNLGFYKDMQTACLMTAAVTFLGILLALLLLYIQKNRKTVICTVYLTSAFFYNVAIAVQFGEQIRMVILIVSMLINNASACILLIKIIENSPTVCRSTLLFLKVDIMYIILITVLITVYDEVFQNYNFWVLYVILNVIGAMVSLFTYENHKMLADYPPEEYFMLRLIA